MNDTLETVARMIGEVMGDDFVPDRPITAETSFSHDLELESIEFVTLSEKLREHYGERVDFVAWFSQKELDEIIELRVGELVRYIDSCLSPETAA